MGFPGHTIDVPRWTPSPGLAELVRSIPHDPFGQRDGLALMLEATPAEDLTGHLCATAWVLDLEERTVLLVRHPVLGWCTPGGHIDQDEDPADAARRELREETGLDLAPASRIPDVLHPAPFPAGPTGPAHWHHNLGYRFEALWAAELSPEPGAPVGWFPVDSLPIPRVPDLSLVLPLLADAR